METYIDNEAKLLAQQRHVYTNEIYFQDWLARRSGTQYENFEQSFKIDPNPNVYTSHVRPAHKPKLDNTHNDELFAG